MKKLILLPQNNIDRNSDNSDHTYTETFYIARALFITLIINFVVLFSYIETWVLIGIECLKHKNCLLPDSDVTCSDVPWNGMKIFIAYYGLSIKTVEKYSDVIFSMYVEVGIILFRNFMVTRW